MIRAVTATAAYGESRPCVRVIGDSVSASALLWLDPPLAGRVAFDGELEVYPQPALRGWVTFQAAQTPDWLSAASGYQILIAS